VQAPCALEALAEEVHRRLRASGAHGLAVAPSLIFLSPRAKREVSPWGPRPERSEGCLAIARQDKVGGTFLNSLSCTISFKKVVTLFCREKPHVSPLGGLSFRAVSQRDGESSAYASKRPAGCRAIVKFLLKNPPRGGGGG